MYDHLNANGATIIFCESNFTAEIRSFNEPPESVEQLDKTHLGSSFTTRRPGKVHNLGEMSMTIIYDPDEDPPIGIMEEIKIIYPPPPNGNTADGAWRKFRGFIANWEPGEASNDTVTEASITIAVDGPIERQPSGTPAPTVAE